MALFLIFGPPFFVWYYLETHIPDWDRKEGIHTFLYGTLLTLPSLLIHGIFQSLFPISTEGWRLFAKGFLLDLIIPLCYILGGYVWWHRKRIAIPLPTQVFRFLTFGAGGLVPIALQAHLSFHGWEEGLQYLLVPLLWIQLLFVGALSIGVWFSTVRWERFLVLGIGFIWVFLLAWFCYLYRINIRFIAWILILGSFVGSIIVFPKLWEKVRYL
ncbi:MAG: hypothetical protein N2442_13130 [Spirochaetes bacterium]|nr:hypothetical protein [Spirochaetota bacterium]